MVVMQIAKFRSNKLIIPQEELYDLYWNQGLSMPQIAEKFEVCQTTIWRLMKEHGIRRRTFYENALGKRNSFYGKKHSATTRKHLSEVRRIKLPISNEELIELYLNKKLSCLKISEKLGCCDKKITNELRRLGIPIRTRKQAAQVKDKNMTITTRRKISAGKRKSLLPLPRFVFGKRRIKTNNKGLSHDEILTQELIELRKKGFRCIPLTRVVPDGIAIKNNEIFAVEIVVTCADYKKYADKPLQYDDIFWTVAK